MQWRGVKWSAIVWCDVVWCGVWRGAGWCCAAVHCGVPWCPVACILFCLITEESPVARGRSRKYLHSAGDFPL